MNNFTKNWILTFKNPYEFLLFYDDDLRNGVTSLYDWQKKILINFGRDLAPNEILRQVAIAANGSGKSKYILAPCIAWIPYSFDYGLSVVTSSSAFQLDTQTERYLNMLIDKINITHKEDFGGIDCWINIKRKKQFLPTGGYIDLFATDESTKAEGKHPLAINSEFAIFVDEGKSIEEPIYDALMRCKGFTRRQDVSSPGNCFGHLYDIFTREELGWEIHKITAFDCPHIRISEIENDILKYGIHDPLVRSSIFAEFTSIDSKTVISYETLLACYRLANTIKHNNFGEHSGLDLAAGGDENVLSIWDGNIMRAQEFARYKNTVEGTKEIIHWIQKHKLDPAKIWADDGGIGRGIIDNLHDRGYKVHRVLNNFRAFDNSRYANLGSENWFSFKRFVEEGLIKLIDDPLLKSQLSNRYYKTGEKSLIQLERKEIAKANGHPSPDRADAAVLAWCNFRFPFEILSGRPKVNEDDKENQQETMTAEEVDNHYRGLARANFGLLRSSFKTSPVLNNIPVENVSSNKGRLRSTITQSDILDRMLGNSPLDKASRWLKNKHN